MPPTVHMVLAQRDVILLMLQRLIGTCVDTDAANSLAERYTTVDEYLRADVSTRRSLSTACLPVFINSCVLLKK